MTLNDLTPLEQSYLENCVKRGSTSTIEEGMADTILSGLCGKPSFDDPLVRWEMNPTHREDGYINKYFPTDKAKALFPSKET